MKLFKSSTLLLLSSMALLPLHGWCQGFLSAKGPKIVNEKGENVLLRGIGLGGWMLQEGYMLRVNGAGQQHKIRAGIESLVGTAKTAEFYNAWLDNHTTKADIDSMKAWGFNSVRLPMHFNLYTLPSDKEPVAGQNTWLEKGFAMTDSLLAWCKANGLYLILDLHAAPGGQGNDLNISDRDGTKPSLWENEADQQKTIALWRKLADRYKDEPYIGAYDIINEPNYGFEDPEGDKNGLKEQNNVPLKRLMQEITKAIREVDTRHIIIIEGNGWGNNYNGILPPWDKNMVLSFHKYWNLNDTKSIQHILDFRQRYNIPVWLGETGENSNVWFTEAIRLFEKNNIGWSWWPLKKLGANNPLEIPANDKYMRVIDYISGKGSAPTADVAFDGLMEVALATNIRRNILHRDVIDAMIRQPFSNKTLPFKPNLINNKGEIKAVDYDLGALRAAYFDTDTANYRISNPKWTGGNSGRVYRNDGVDIKADPNETDSYFVTDIATGEWLQYTTNILLKGQYNISVIAAPGKTAGKLALSIGGKPIGKVTVTPAKDNSTQTWQTYTINNIPLQKGSQVMKVVVENGGMELKSIRFEKIPGR
ncbi:cellulase family glycosylhydrolase [Chitinophaga rhizophila]|uniref:Cellulase family glycosylhydrolase n=1 Tax=Chitinophaga rhizophila TaxID=2866212 RepID=A0ABS7GIE1_9BACT|nr:cellulase family glycosylhydrolase [Chitinophaga rhizophila]MBW8687015.1 cellulase family glycosylhydrolase [Chitinophaga rhizophila]